MRGFALLQARWVRGVVIGRSLLVERKTELSRPSQKYPVLDLCSLSVEIADQCLLFVDWAVSF